MAVFQVVDANNKRVGDFISFNGDSAIVQLRINNNYYVIPVYRDRIGETPLGEFQEPLGGIRYMTNSCFGNGYIYAQQSSILSIIDRWILTPSGWVLLNPNVTPADITVLSEKRLPDWTCQSVDPYTESHVPATFGPDFRVGFTPPFRFE